MDTPIYNITDLRLEIERLKASKQIQEEAIAAHFKSPGAIISTITHAFRGTAGDVKGSILGGQDIYGLVSRVVLPFLLNKTIFRGSNFIIKAAVGLLSQKASEFVNEKNVVSIWDKIMSVIPKKKSKKVSVDYGIPPYSKSY
jgi:hypothetical protein